MKLILSIINLDNNSTAAPYEVLVSDNDYTEIYVDRLGKVKLSNEDRAEYRLCSINHLDDQPITFDNLISAISLDYTQIDNPIQIGGQFELIWRNLKIRGCAIKSQQSAVTI